MVLLQWVFWRYPQDQDQLSSVNILWYSPHCYSDALYLIFLWGFFICFRYWDWEGYVYCLSGNVSSFMILGHDWCSCLSRLSCCLKCSYEVYCLRVEYWPIIFHKNCYPWGCLFSWEFSWPCLGWDFAVWVHQGLKGRTVSLTVLIPWFHWYWSQHILQFNHGTPTKRTHPGHCCHQSRLFLQLVSQNLFIIFISNRWADFHAILIYCSIAKTLCFREVRILWLSLWKHDDRAMDKANHVWVTLCSYFRILWDLWGSS